MSTIGVKYHNEDIHNIIQRPISPTIKSPRYKSKRKFLDSLNEKRKYNGHQTFGLAHYEAPESWNYLKKGKSKVQSPVVKLIDRKEFKCTINCKSSPVPKCSFENPKRSEKNYVKENIKKIASIEPKVPCPRRVETPKGTVKELAHLLEMIKIRQSNKYGKIPKYLCERRKQWAKEEEKKKLQELAVKEYKEKMGIGTMGMGENVYMIDEETRQKILKGLKENWNELSKQFLKLPVLIDTLPKIKRKMWLEKEIDQLERDVKLVESHPYIYLERFDRRPYEEILAEEMRLVEEKKIQRKEKEQKEKEIETGTGTEAEAEAEAKDAQIRVDQIPEDKKEDDEEVKILDY